MKNKVLMWCARVEVDDEWGGWDEWAKTQPQKANTDPMLVDGIWWDFGFETRKERSQFVKEFKARFPKMGRFGQLCLYREVEG